MQTLETRIIHVSIARDWRAVYDFAAEPANMPRWAAGLGRNFARAGEVWTADGPGGPVTIRFAPRNHFGVLDHVVTLRSGVDVAVPLRVVQNGGGAEVIFTLFRQPGMSPADLARDAEAVTRDLNSLKALMETAA
ncbi:SRPBCC family protein [Phreatobacter stygius]|uniref:SRPBCC family protein n=1 Tax=Phreatobacter stygius TaxID=1940610 RepID=A0A4D7B603_9HYPH|nr:SRPBCC family protein [Phreatobacter stygius]QCI69369.1 SRPBCC family protein [Phreatobacter stygius]